MFLAVTCLHYFFSSLYIYMVSRHFIKVMWLDFLIFYVKLENLLRKIRKSYIKKVISYFLACLRSCHSITGIIPKKDVPRSKVSGHVWMSWNNTSLIACCFGDAVRCIVSAVKKMAAYNRPLTRSIYDSKYDCERPSNLSCSATKKSWLKMIARNLIDRTFPSSIGCTLVQIMSKLFKNYI